MVYKGNSFGVWKIYLFYLSGAETKYIYKVGLNKFKQIIRLYIGCEHLNRVK